jgi:ABC-2 type transport system ATP-binding protein
MQFTIRTEQLTRRFGTVTAVDELDLAVPRGSVYGLLGLNGAGKTTTVRMLTGLVEPTGGSAEVVGKAPAEQRAELARELGVVFGESRTPEPRFTPVRYVRYFGRMQEMDRARIDERARGLFDQLEFAEYAERPIGELSTGNKRKTEIARALIHEPRVLFLDEPTRGLDIPSKRRMWAFLRYLVDERDRTIFLSSHDTEEIASLCDRIGILRKGQKRWEGTTGDLASEGADMSQKLSDRLQGRGTEFSLA